MALLARLPWSLQQAMGRALGAVLQLVLAQRRRIAARFDELDTNRDTFLSLAEVAVGATPPVKE